MDGVQGSGRGWVRELQGGDGPGLDWGRGEGGGVCLQSPHRSRKCPYAGCLSMRGMAGRGYAAGGLSRTGVARDSRGPLGWQDGRPVAAAAVRPGVEWLAAGPRRDLNWAFPRPAPGEMQSVRRRRRAGDPSHQSEDPPPEGSWWSRSARPRPMRAVQRARLCAITWTASQAPLAAKRPDGMMVQPDAVLEGRVWRSRPRRGGDDRPPVRSVSPSRSVMKA